MIAYVTGVAGFLGSRTAVALLDAGWQVYGCDTLVTGHRVNVPDPVAWTHSDIRDLTARDLPAGCRLVVHCAAIARSRWPNLNELWNVNGYGSRTVAAAAANIEADLVVASSCVAALPSFGAYALSKHTGERAVARHHPAAALLRFSNLYGAGQSETGAEPNVLAAWRRQRRETGEIVVYGTGRQTRDFLHVRDAAAAVLAAVGRHGTWDICTGVQTPIIDVAHLFGVPIIHRPPPQREPQSWPQNPVSAAEQLGWVAHVPLADGISEVITDQ